MEADCWITICVSFSYIARVRMDVDDGAAVRKGEEGCCTDRRSCNFSWKLLRWMG